MGTHNQNVQHAFDNKLRIIPCGEGNHWYGRKHSNASKAKMSISRIGNYNAAKLNKEDVVKIKKLLCEGKTLTYIAAIYNIQISTVSNIKNGKSWKMVLAGDEG